MNVKFNKDDGRTGRFFVSVAFGLLITLALVSVSFAGAAQAPDDATRFFQRDEQICRDIEKITGLAFTNKVKMAVQLPEAFRSYVKESIVREYGEGGIEGYTRALVKLGALERPMDLSATLLDLMASQALAHYDPGKKTFFLLQTNMPATLLDPTAAHELCHALQDQRHDLYKFVDEDIEQIRDNGDAAMAKESLVEGEAMYVMALWMMVQTIGDDQGMAEDMVKVAMETEASMSFNQLMDLSEMQIGTAPGAAPMLASIKDMRNAPRFIMEPLLAVYIQGGLMVAQVKVKGGWKAVEDLFDHPPRSSKEVLHPEKLGGPDKPIDVRLPELKRQLANDWRLVNQDVMGEMGIRVFFEIWLKDEEKKEACSIAKSAAAGWGGDRYYYFENKDSGKDLLVWQTVWDTAEGAGEFAVAYRMALTARFPNLKKSSRSDEKNLWKYQIWEVEPGRFLKLATSDKTVVILDTTDKTLLDSMWK